MIAELNQAADHTEMRTRLANLKLNEAETLRECAEMERDLAAKEGEALKIRRQIEQLTANIYQGGGYNQSGFHNRIASVLGPTGRMNVPVISAEQVGTMKKAPGRPKREDIENAGGNAAQGSLPTLIEKLLRENKDGLSLAELIEKIRETGYVSLSRKPRSMLDQAIFRLKKKERIVRNPDSLKFFLKEEAV